MRAPLERSLDAYAQLFASIGLGRDELSDAATAYRGWMQDHTPGLLLELEAMAGGAGVNAASLLTLNARTEVLAVATRRMPWAKAVSECSTLAGETTQGPWLVQNWDWYVDHAAARVVWVVPLDSERWFATFTEVGVLAKIGLNDRGVAVGLVELAPIPT